MTIVSQVIHTIGTSVILTHYSKCVTIAKLSNVKQGIPLGLLDSVICNGNWLSYVNAVFWAGGTYEAIKNMIYSLILWSGPLLVVVLPTLNVITSSLPITVVVVYVVLQQMWLVSMYRKDRGATRVENLYDILRLSNNSTLAAAVENKCAAKESELKRLLFFSRVTVGESLLIKDSHLALDVVGTVRAADDFSVYK